MYMDIKDDRNFTKRFFYSILLSSILFASTADLLLSL